MQTGYPPNSEPEEIADANTNADNWAWQPSHSRIGWTKASTKWQDFSTAWWGKGEKEIGDTLSLSHFLVESASSVLIRKCYVDMFDHVWAYALNFKGRKGIILTGQPGIGKTLFQPYLLIRLLQRNQVVLFSLDGREVYLFYFGEVYTAIAGLGLKLPEAKASSSPVFLWSLFDVELQMEPESVLTKSPCFPLQTTSPDSSRYKIWSKKKWPTFMGFPLWTREELVQGLKLQTGLAHLLPALKLFCEGKRDNEYLRFFPDTRALLEDRFQEELSLQVEDTLEYLLDVAIERFGYAAGDVYSGIFDFYEQTRCHDLSNMSITDLQNLAFSLNVRIGPQNPAACHRILALIPVAHEDYRGDWEVTFKSEWIAKHFMDMLAAQDENEIRRHISLFKSNPATNSIAGDFFEPLAHRMLASTNTGDFWPLKVMRSSRNTNNPTVFLDPSPTPAQVRFAMVERPIHRFHDLPQHLLSGTYYWPYATHHSLFSAFTVEIEENSAVLWILQMTMSRAHQGPAKGYRNIRDIIQKLKTQMRDRPPPGKAQKAVGGGSASAPSVQVRYILVVPHVEGGGGGLKWTFPHGWNDSCIKDDLRGETYFLEVPLNDPANLQH